MLEAETPRDLEIGNLPTHLAKVADHIEGRTERKRPVRRLSKTEAAEYRKKLSCWNSFRDADEIMIEIGDNSQLFSVSQGSLKFWREAWVAMSCMQLTHAQRVRLGEDPPDFWLDYGTHIQAFEIVTLLPEGMLLGQHYNRYATDLLEDRPTTLVERSFEQKGIDLEMLPGKLAAQIEAKCAKGYPPDTILVADIIHELHLEIDTGPVRKLITAALPALKAFSEIWLRRGNGLVRISPSFASLIMSPFR